MVERELGRGGMGVVYLAWEPSLQRQVALKVIPGDPLTDPQARRRWLAEARRSPACTIPTWCKSIVWTQPQSVCIWSSNT